MNSCCLSPQGPIGVPGMMGEPGLFGAKVTNIMAPASKGVNTECYIPMGITLMPFNAYPQLSEVFLVPNEGKCAKTAQNI